MRSPMELWGGIECTINRVGDAWFNQCEKSGHFQRLSDFDRIADLGIRTLRYPVLWEQHAPRHPAECDFSDADMRLARLRDLRIQPIVTLLHHGSGPHYTSLVDPDFPEKLAAYARRVARQFPWLDRFTPVNEPLTTARFSGLYGHWFPHARDERIFVRCLLNQVRGTILAMRAIREINPAAQLVCTEDLAKIFSTPELAYQADFENERRWVSFDLIAGRLRRDCRMYHHLRWLGISAETLDWFVNNGTPPNLLGLNYYVTSERFLDHRLALYPAHAHAANGRERYADVAACHVRAPGMAGLETLLLECHQRYRLPMAVTEAHLGCTSDEQIRWLAEMWRDAQRARERGATVRALTAWSLLGSFNWNSLVTRDDHYYEPGVFDIRAAEPQPTELAGLCRQLAAGLEPAHPALATPGWWRRPERFIFGEPFTAQEEMPEPAVEIAA